MPDFLRRDKIVDILFHSFILNSTVICTSFYKRVRIDAVLVLLVLLLLLLDIFVGKWYSVFGGPNQFEQFHLVLNVFIYDFDKVLLQFFD